MQAREHNHDTYIALTKYIYKTIRLFTTTSRNNPTGCSRFCVGVSFSPASIFLKRRGRRVRSDYQTISSKDFQGFTSIRRKSVRIGIYTSKYEIDDRFGLILQFYSSCLRILINVHVVSSSDHQRTTDDGLIKALTSL